MKVEKRCCVVKKKMMNAPNSGMVCMVTNIIPTVIVCQQEENVRHLFGAIRRTNAAAAEDQEQGPPKGRHLLQNK